MLLDTKNILSSETFKKYIKVVLKEKIREIIFKFENSFPSFFLVKQYVHNRIKLNFYIHALKLYVIRRLYVFFDAAILNY